MRRRGGRRVGPERSAQGCGRPIESASITSRLGRCLQRYGEFNVWSKAWKSLGMLALAAGLCGAVPAWAQKVRLNTSAGDIVVELDREKAPKTVDNFVQYVKAGHYDGTIFHRVIDGFMIQGGGLKPDLSEKPTRGAIPLESRNGLTNVRGTLAMARTMVPDSATAQFFINVRDNAFLDAANSRDGNGYAVFGKVIDGMDVVDKIKGVATTPKGQHQNVPVADVVIKKATLEN
jgi:peptidyl-prolyl cis-trans isomerase A (cyclophilin A)